MKQTSSAHEILMEIAAAAADVLITEAGMDAQLAAYVGRRIMRKIVEVSGGCALYIPKATWQQRTERNQALVREFTGTNHRDLARKYGISVAHVYRVLAEASPH